MATSPQEMFGGLPIRQKPLSECCSCKLPATCWPNEKWPNVRFCEHHGNQLILATVRKVLREPVSE